MKPRMPITQKIDKYRDEVIEKNCENFHAFSFGGMLITGIILLVGICVSHRLNFVAEYLSLFAYMIVLFFVSKYCVKKKPRSITLIYYAALLPIYIIGILMGTFFDPSRPAITIMILLCGLTVFIIDKPARMLLYTFCIALLFLICSLVSKSSDVFTTDLINLMVYFAVSIGINFFSLKDRVISVENFVLARVKSERDPMTLLLNRGTGEQQVRKLIAADIRGSFMIIDIDNFKGINDTYGHQAGDEVILKLTEKLQSFFRPTDVIWRLGGDEFAVYAAGLLNPEICQHKFTELKSSLSKLKILGSDCNSVSISAGCTICREETMNFEELYNSSDKALYEAKRTNKGSCVIIEK